MSASRVGLDWLARVLLRSVPATLPGPAHD